MGTTRFDQKQKLEVLKSTEKLGIRDAVKVAGVHYTTVYEWRKQLEALGEEGFLKYASAYPGRGDKVITPDQEEQISDVWRRNPGYGPGQVRSQLRRQGVTISIRTIRKVMKANGYEKPGKQRDKKEIQRFEASRPLELAQMDILEYYINKLKVYLILLLDDFSRFILGWRLSSETSIDWVVELVSDAIRRHGKMEELLTDRGFVFYSWRGINRFEKFLEFEGIDHTHARPHHPQTLGKVEACNKRIQWELLRKKQFVHLAEAETAIGEWVDQYNYHRGHQGIGGLVTPAERFQGRERQVVEELSKGMDITAGPVVEERSIANLVLGPDGRFTFYLLGQPVMLWGENDADAIHTGRDRHHH